MRALTFLFCLISIYTFGQSFTEINQFFDEIGEGGIDWGDLDKDGDLDFVVSGFDTKVYVNNNGSFSIGQSLSYTENGSSPNDNFNHGNVQIADLNNDGSLDIIISGWTGSSEMTRVFINNGFGSFSWNFQLANATGRFCLVKDVNNDNLLDIIHVDYGALKIFRNNSAASFELAFEDDAAVSDHRFVEAGDMDNDGKVELFLTTNQGIRVYKNEGEFKFSQMNSLEFASVEDDGSVSALDYNKDGLLDLITTGFGLEAVPVYYNNKSTFKLDSSNSFIEEIARGSIDWGDCDNDGDLDLLVTGLRWSGSVVAEVYNNKNGIFEKNLSALTGIIYGEGKWGDYDNDGDLDILLWGSGNLKVYSNNLVQTGYVINNKPNSPQNLSFIQEYDTIVVRWTNTIDNETPATGLSYNVWIKKSGGEFLVSPNADAISGQLWSSTFGNAFGNNSFKIHGLEVGQTYEWGVQAIDGGFMASEFAESSFTYSEPIEPELPVAVEKSKSSISLYPNPTNGLLHVNALRGKKIRITIIDQLGRKSEPIVLSDELLDLREFSNGGYRLQVIDGNHVESFNIIKN